MLEGTEFETRFRAATMGLKKSPGIVEDSLERVETTETYDGLGDKVSAASMTAINFFQHPGSHPVVLDLLLLKKYGPEWMTWEPETVVARIPQDFRTSDVSDLNLHKIQAMKALHFNDTYWQRWEVFNWCTQAFSGIAPDFEVMQVPSTAQLLVSVDTARRVREDVEFTEEIRYFMLSTCKHDGIFCPPEPLDFLKVHPDNDFLNCEEISKAWPKVRSSGTAPRSDTITAEQLRRMLDAHQFLEESRERLQAQLALVPHA
jgi:hypothetical protein